MSVIDLFSACRKYRRSLRQATLAPLDNGETAALQAHLARCPQCRHYQSQLTQLSQGLCQLKAKGAAELPLDLHFRRQWQRVILNQSQRETTQDMRSSASLLQQAAWSGLAAIWLLIFFFQWTAPPVPQALGGISPSQGALALSQLRQPLAQYISINRF